jgi:Domain of Unknown Function with PDB structure (DUF3857)/Transglutaminase-like superfamily
MSIRPTNLLLALAAILCFASATIAGDDWKPVDPSELALKAGIVDKDADAEALFWEVKLNDDDPSETVFNHHIRMKIFTERGKESQSKVDIPFNTGTKIQDIAARTIKADGTIIELKKADVFERTIVKVSGVKVKAKSFAVPGIEPGVIVEYRWKEVRESLGGTVRLQFQRDVPVEKVTYYVKPYSGSYGMKYQPFQIPRDVRFEKAKDGFYSIGLVNVPAYTEEARMPPENSVKSWVLLYYDKDTQLKPDKYWKDFGKNMYSLLKSDMKVSDEVRKASAEAVGDATDPEKKLERIYTFCQTKIKNLSGESSGLTREERAKIKPNKSPSGTLSKGAGKNEDISMLFAAMATAAGFEVRPALISNRGDAFFDPNFANPYFLAGADIAVKLGETWKFFDPGTNYLPYGMLRWQEEGEQALITDSKEPVWVDVPLSAPQRSLTKRTGKFRLLEDGTLEGDVRVELTGQAGIEAKIEDDGLSPAERETSLREDVKGRLSTAELTEIKIENVTDQVKPYTYSYHVKVPGFAERTGKRLFLQPAYFKRNIGPMFSASARKNAIYFHYPWAEQDNVEIDLPEGFELDNADAPMPYGSGELTQYNAAFSVTTDHKKLFYKRSFFFGGGGTQLNRLLYPVAKYPALKQYFDTVSKNDSHTITLKQGAPAASSGASK